MAIFADFYNAGNVPEFVINQLFDITPVVGPFTQRIAHDGATSSKAEWIDHVLATANKDNAIIDNAAASDDSTSQGRRLAQQMQLYERGIVLGDQASGSEGFDNITQFEKQLEYRTNELYRDYEATALSQNASVVGTSGTAAKAAGFFAQVATAISFGTGGSAGGWNSGTGVFDAPTAGTARPLSETNILTVMETASKNGAYPDGMSMVPALKTKFSNFMMTSSSRVGVLVTQAPGGAGGATAVQSVMTYESDHGTLEVINNKIQVDSAANVSDVAIFQTDMAQSFDQWTPRAKRLGPTGAGERWQVTQSVGIALLNEKAHAGVLANQNDQDMVQ